MDPFLKTVDMFGAEFKLNIKGKETFTTLLGGIFTVLLGMATIILAWYFGKDIYLKSSPYYLSKTAYKQLTAMIDFTSFNFCFALHVEDVQGRPILNERFFHYTFYYEYYKIDTVLGSNELLQGNQSDCELCNTDHIDNETITSKGLHNFYCSNLNGYKLGGNWRAPHIAIIYYYLSRCTPEWAESRNITCASREEFDKLGRLYLSYYVFQNLLDPENFEIPLKKIYSYNFQGLDLGNVYPQYKFYYSFSNLTTDHGLVFEDSQNTEFLNYDELQIDTNHTPNQDSFLEISFYLSSKNQLHVRSYIKVPDIVAQVGGILSLFLPFIEIFIKIFSDNQYTLYLFNNLFKLQLKDNNTSENFNNIIELNVKHNNINGSDKIVIIDENNKSKKIVKDFTSYNEQGNNQDINEDNKGDLSKSTNSMLPLGSVNNKDKNSIFLNNYKLRNYTKKEVILNKELEKVITFKSKQCDNVEISECKRLYFTYCCGKNKLGNDKLFKLILVAEDELSKKCDFTEITKSLDQFRLLKKLILNEGQCTLLKSREFKTLTDESLIEDVALHDEKMKKDIIMYLKTRQENGTLNQIDKVLTNYLQVCLKEIIKSELNI